MDQNLQQEEFEIIVDGSGSFRIPEPVRRRLRPGHHYIVRMSRGKLHPRLRRRGVTEDEIEHIVRLQFEPRDNVVRFLESEGLLKGDAGFVRLLRNRAT